MKHAKYLILFACAVVIAFSSSCSKKTAVAARTIRIGIQPSAAFVPLYVVRYTGALEAALAQKNVTVVWQDFQSGPPMNESLAADLTDIGVIGDVPTVLALAGSTRMKLVGIPARGPDAYALISRAADRNLTVRKDIKGKRIATVFGSTGHNFTKKLLEEDGLSLENIEFLNIAVGNAEEVLESNTADAVVIWEPNVTRMVDKGLAKIVAQGSETNLRGTNGFVVREEFLASSSDIVKAVLEAYATAASQLDSLDDATVVKLSNGLQITKDQLQKILRKYDFTVAITKEDIASLQDTIRFLVSINNLPTEYPVEGCIDSSCLP